MFRRVLLIVALWVLPVLALAQPPARTILVMGDSLSAAYGIDTDAGWVALLQARLVAQGYDYTVVNASISGETSSGGLTRLPAALSEHKPRIVILELGANDGLRATPVKVLQDNLGRMIRLSSAAGAKVLLVGIVMPPNYGGPYTRQFAAAYPALARQYQVPLVPFLLQGVADQRDLMQQDGLHPLAPGEPKVLDNVWPLLKPLLHK